MLNVQHTFKLLQFGLFVICHFGISEGKGAFNQKLSPAPGAAGLPVSLFPRNSSFFHTTGKGRGDESWLRDQFSWRATPGRARVSHCSKRMTQFRNNAPRRRARERDANKHEAGQRKWRWRRRVVLSSGCSKRMLRVFRNLDGHIYERHRLFIFARLM